MNDSQVLIMNQINIISLTIFQTFCAIFIWLSITLSSATPPIINQLSPGSRMTWPTTGICGIYFLPCSVPSRKLGNKSWLTERVSIIVSRNEDYSMVACSHYFPSVSQNKCYANCWTVFPCLLFTSMLECKLYYVLIHTYK